MLTEEELAVLWALSPSVGRAAEELRQTTPYGVAALVRHLQRLQRLGYIEIVGDGEPEAAETPYVLTYEGMGVVGPVPAPAADEDVQKAGQAG